MRDTMILDTENYQIFVVKTEKKLYLFQTVFQPNVYYILTLLYKTNYHQSWSENVPINGTPRGLHHTAYQLFWPVGSV